MEECDAWQWMIHHVESSFFAIDSSAPAGDWMNVASYSQDFRSFVCQGRLPSGEMLCRFPELDRCWPAYALGGALAAVVTDNLLNTTLHVLDVLVHRSAASWVQAVRARWPIFGVMLRLLARLAGGAAAGQRCEPSGLRADVAHAEIGAAYMWLWRLTDARGQGTVPTDGLRQFVAVSCPHWEQLDRDACAQWIGGSKGRVRLFGHREVISDRIRGTGHPACGLGVDDQVDHAIAEAARRRGELPQVVEIGPFLCDCLWVHAKAVRRWLAFEVNAAAAALCGETIRANGLEASASVVVAAVGDGRPVRTAANAAEPSWVTSRVEPAAASDSDGGGGWTPTVRLDDHPALADGEVIDLLIVHTNGFEHVVLKGAMGLLRSGRVRAVVAPLIGPEDWTRSLPGNFTLRGRTAKGMGFIRQEAIAAHWSGG